MLKPSLPGLRWAVIAGLSFFGLTSAHGAPIVISITGNWGAVTTGPGLSTTPFDNGPGFAFSTTITNSTPTAFNAGETQLPTVGGYYTNGGLTAALSSLEQLIFTDPTVWNGQDIGFSVYDVYFVGDQLQLEFNGPQLFSGATSAPTITTGQVLGQEAWYGFSGRYFNGTGYSSAVLEGNATITLTDTGSPLTDNAPEPSTAFLAALAALPLIVLRRRRV